MLGALGRLSANPVVNGAASLYVSVIRGTPLLVQIFVWTFALAELGLVLPLFWAGIISLGVNYGAYMTEIFRAGIQAVPRGQREAAQALGMPERLVMRRIVLPQAIRIVIPAIGNDFIAMIKDTSLVFAIGIQELTFRAQLRGPPDDQHHGGAAVRGTHLLDPDPRSSRTSSNGSSSASPGATADGAGRGRRLGDRHREVLR